MFLSHFRIVIELMGVLYIKTTDKRTIEIHIACLCGKVVGALSCSQVADSMAGVRFTVILEG